MSNNIEDAQLRASQLETFPYEIVLYGKSYTVLKNVFSPKYFPDVDMFAEQLPIHNGCNFLEIGTGIGYIPIEAAYKGANQAVAIDMNPHAVENAQLNIQRHQMTEKVEARLGNVYSALQDREKFDVIYWNVPFLFVEANSDKSMLQQSTYDIGYQSVNEYVQKGIDYLTEQGRLFISFSSSIGRLDILQAIVKQQDARLRCIMQKNRMRNNQATSYELFEVLYI